MTYRVRRLFTHNWFEKIFAIVLATLLWAAVAADTQSEIGMDVPLEYRNVPQQMEITGDATNTVEVRLRGSANLMRQISPSEISATIDLGGIETGDQIITLTPLNVQAPFGIEVVRVNPSRVRLHIEKTLTKRLEVRPRLQGLPGEGYEVRQVLISPDTVEISGPESRVGALESVSTEAINVAGKVSDMQVAADLDLADPLVRLQRLTTVQVRVEIRRK